jgi:hypothetical protein
MQERAVLHLPDDCDISHIGHDFWHDRDEFKSLKCPFSLTKGFPTSSNCHKLLNVILEEKTWYKQACANDPANL